MKYFVILFNLLLGILTVNSQCGLTSSIVLKDLDNEMADTTNVSIVVSGAVNNNLATIQQGLCGVQLKFKHPFMKELFIELTSPSGEKITLVGGEIVATNTPFITWDVTFVPCPATAVPDPGFEPQWENNQIWQSFNTYSGQYHPYLGCLGDFDIGTVNGTWTLRCIDFEDEGKGTLLNAQLIFCQEQGISCSECVLNPGNISNPDIFTCQGDPALNLQINKTFPGNVFNDTIYNYTNVIFKDSTIIRYQNAPDLRTSNPGVYTICGLQSAKAQASIIPAIGTRYDNLTLENYFFNKGACASVSDSCVNVTISASTPPVNIVKYICKNDVFTVGNSNYNQPGIYNIVIENGVCDSVVNLDLRIIDIQADILADRDSITCNGNTIALQGSNKGTVVNPLNYRWFTLDGIISTDVTDFIVDVTQAGTYFLEITGTSNGVTCKDTTTKVIIEDESFPVISFITDTITCAKDTILLSSQISLPVVTTTWSSVATLPFGETSTGIKVWKPGVYYLSVIGENGCPSTDSITVIEDKLLNDANISVDTINCIKDSVQIILMVDESNEYSYQWSGVAPQYTNEKQPFVKSEGFYSLLFTNVHNGCSKIYNVEVIADLRQPIIFLNPSDTINCKTIEVSPDLSADVPIATYNWQGPSFTSGGANPVIKNEGTYNVTITSALNGCQSSSSFEVFKDSIIPNLVLMVDSISCDKDSVQITFSSDKAIESVFWFGPLGFASQEIAPYVSEPGVYYVDYSGRNGCKGSEQIQVSYASDKPKVIYTLDSLSCGLDTIMLNAAAISTSYTYQWEGPGLLDDNVASPGIFLPGTYKVTVTDPINGCTTEQILEVVDDRIYTDPQILVEPLDCQKDSIQIQLLNTDVKSILYTGPGFTSVEFNPYINNVGTYSFVLVNQKNCVSEGTFEVIRNDTLPILNPLFELFTCGKDSVMLQGVSSLAGTSYTWQGPSGYTRTGAIVYAKTGGQYTVIGMAPNGCKAEKIINIGYDTISPRMEILPSDTITCIRDTVVLKTNFDPSIATLQWSSGIPSGDYLKVIAPGTYIATALGKNNCITADTVVVIENKILPVFNVSASVITCKNILSTIKIVPGQDIKSIKWNNATNPSFIEDEAREVNTSFYGMYSFLITNLEGCTLEGRVEVLTDTVPPQIISIIQDTITCNQVTVQIGVVLDKNGKEFLWNGPGVVDVVTDSLLSVTEGGKYFLKITGDNSCVSTSVFDIIKSNDIPEYNIFTDTLTCDNGKINIGVIPVTGNLSYKWEGPENFESSSRTPKVFLAGIYRVTVTGANGCSSTSNVTVIENKIKPSITIKDTILLPCDTSLVSLTVNSDLPLSGYKWVFPDGTIENSKNPGTSVPGMYQVQVTGLNGCPSDILIFQILVDNKPPGFTVKSDTITCSNPVALLIAGSLENDVSYKWFSPSGAIVNGSTLSTIESGFFKLIVSNNRGCRDSLLLEVARDTIKPGIIIEKTGDIQCNVRDVTLDASGSDGPEGFDVSWSTSNGNITQSLSEYIIMLDTPGFYRFSLINKKNGCAASENVIISETPQAFTSLDFELMSPICQEINNGSIVIQNLNGTAPYHIVVNTKDQGQSLSLFNLSGGNYSYTVTDSLGCVVQKDIVLPNAPDLNVGLEKEMIILFGDSLLLVPQYVQDPTGRATLKWYIRDSLLCEGCPSLWVRPFVNTYYDVEYSVNGLCKKTARVLVKVKNDIEKSIPNVFAPGSGGGNPLFYIPQERGIKMIQSIKIFDRWAENVYLVRNLMAGDSSLGWDGTFNGKECQMGIYVVIAELVLADGTIWKYQGDLLLVR